jgi:hypothetical protein
MVKRAMVIGFIISARDNQPWSIISIIRHYGPPGISSEAPKVGWVPCKIENFHGKNVCGFNQH